MPKSYLHTSIILQQAAERGFDLDQTADGCLVLSTSLQEDLTTFDAETKQANFNAGTYGLWHLPRAQERLVVLSIAEVWVMSSAGTACETSTTTLSLKGDVAGIKCLSPDCGKDAAAAK